MVASRAAKLCILLVALVGCGKKAGPGAPSNTALTPATHTDFPIATGPHAVDCNNCHGDFSTFKQFTCLSCHAHDQAPTDSSHLGVAGYAYTSAACYSCHPAGTAVAPSTASSDPTQSITLNALIPSYAGTSISSLSPQVETLPMTMNHGATQVIATAFSACGNCHASASSGVYYPGNLHSSLANLKLAQPTSCSDCHTTMPTGLVGPTATNPARTPASGEMKHDAVAWSNGAPTTTQIVTSDCGVCHKSPGGASSTWATGTPGTTPAQFHASLTQAGLPQPTSCVDCHANSRPNAVLTSANASLPATLQFDHTATAALADCATCHVTGSSSQWTSWSGGRFHPAGGSTPTTCVPCHEGERPTSTASWASATYTAAPFDYVTNTAGIAHGDGQDCAVCHTGPGTGAWGGTQNWIGGHFAHGASTVASTTCIACHMSQRPDLQPGTTAAAMNSLLGFDHSTNGTGDCFACHQSTVAAGSYVNYLNPTTHSLPNGDWKGGQTYPGSTLASGSDQFVKITEISLNRSGAYNLVTSTSSTLATLYNAMLHVSTALPSSLNAGPASNPDYTKCWHCHTNSNGTVTSYANGQYHPALTNYSATPGGTVTPLPQPTTQCTDCHTQMRPVGIVEKAASDLQPMDHNALFTATVNIGGVAVNGVAGIECAVCHHSPGTTWTDGAFHANIGSAVPQDCTVCHYPLMADAAKADLTNGVNYTMKHGSTQLTFQNCQTCHTTALARGATTPIASTLWQGGALHPSLASQPTACNECHTGSEPAANASTQSSVIYSLTPGGTATNQAQWMNHGSSFVAGKDCAVCHAADAKKSGSAWNKADSFHAAVPGANTCQGCHGLTNGGGAVPGTNNNLPAGLTNSSTLTTASSDSTTGVPAGTYDQINHADINVTSHDCNFCHTQVGASTTAGIQGKEWAQARFHVNFTASTPLVMNGTTGRCSNCHMNVKPGASFTAQDHSTFSSTSGTEDCSSCHSLPGTGTTSSPNWLGATGVPQYITVGGFTIPQPPASAATIQTGISNLPHPTVTGIACTTCHTSSSGGKGAFGYDHLSTLINSNCDSCHEAGSNLIGTPWNNATAEGAGAGDTRPYTLTSMIVSYSGNTLTVTRANHFYPVDCNQCHVVPSGDGFVTTGSAYLQLNTNSGNLATGAWAFGHKETKMTNPSTCVMCHTNGIPN